MSRHASKEGERKAHQGDEEFIGEPRDLRPSHDLARAGFHREPRERSVHPELPHAKSHQEHGEHGPRTEQEPAADAGRPEQPEEDARGHRRVIDESLPPLRMNSSSLGPRLI